MVYHDLWYNCWTFVYFDLFITLTFHLCCKPFVFPELPFLCWPPFPIVYPTNILLTIPSCLPWPIVAEQSFTLNYCLPSIHFVCPGILFSLTFCLPWPITQCFYRQEHKAPMIMITLQSKYQHYGYLVSSYDGAPTNIRSILCPGAICPGKHRCPVAYLYRVYVRMGIATRTRISKGSVWLRMKIILALMLSQPQLNLNTTST